MTAEASSLCCDVLVERVEKLFKVWRTTATVIVARGDCILVTTVSTETCSSCVDQLQNNQEINNRTSGALNQDKKIIIRIQLLVHVSGTRSRSGYSVLPVTKIQWPTSEGRAPRCCKGHAKITRSRTTPWSCQWTYYYLFLPPSTNHHPLQYRVTLCRNCNSILSVTSSRVAVKLFSTIWVSLQENHQ